MSDLWMLRGGTLIPGDSRPPIVNGAITLRDGMIEAVLPSGAEPPVVHDYQVVDLAGRYLLPGLIHAHLHLQLDASPNPQVALSQEDPFLTHYRVAQRARTILQHGITTVRDCGARDVGVLRLRDAIEKGVCTGPRVVAPGRPINQTGGHFAVCCVSVDGRDEMRKVVREQLEAGADFIKLIASGGFGRVGGRPEIPELSVEEIAMAVEEADRAGKKVAAHAYGTRAIKRVLEAGAQIVEHCAYADDEVIDRMLSNGAWALPTLTNSHNLAVKARGLLHPDITSAGERMYADTLERFRLLYRAGVKMAAGSDGGSFLNPHEDLVTELEIRVANGVSTSDAISMATSLAAELSDMADRVGTLDAGKYADLLVVDADPLADVANLRRVAMVFKEGQCMVQTERRLGDG